MGRYYLKQLEILLESDKVRGEAQELAAQLHSQGLTVNVRDAGGGLAEKDKEGILWLTDSPQAAALLMREQLPVMAYLHEQNKGKAFPGIRYAAESPQELPAAFFDQIYRRFEKIPWDIVLTDRCLVRETTVEDAQAFAGIYADPFITRYTEPFCYEPSGEREMIRQYIEKVYEFYGYGVWSVVWKETGEVIGRVGFEFHDTKEGIPELGYMIAVPWQGKGIAEEVCRQVLAYGKEELGFELVQVRIDRRNTASLRLAEKLGFGSFTQAREDREGILRGILKL